MRSTVHGAIRPELLPDVSRVCSVYRRDRGSYDYYLVSRPPGMKRVNQANPVGLALADALPDLPRPAKRIGQGERAIGTIVDDRRVALDVGDVLFGGIVAGLTSALVSWLLRE